jgi:uncharacterized protein (TIGR02301 family)
MNRLRSFFRVLILALALAPVGQAGAIDPLYQSEMRRLVEIMGSLYFLEPLCGKTTADWRAEAADLIKRDAPDPDREQRLYGAFNQGYEAYARLHRFCTPAAREAMLRLIDEAEDKSKNIHSRYAE